MIRKLIIFGTLMLPFAFAASGQMLQEIVNANTASAPPSPVVCSTFIKLQPSTLVILQPSTLVKVQC